MSSYGSTKVITVAELAIAEARLAFEAWNVESMRKMSGSVSERTLREAERDLIIAEQNVIIAKQRVHDTQ
jgi:hypothetical protein